MRRKRWLYGGLVGFLTAVLFVFDLHTYLAARTEVQNHLLLAAIEEGDSSTACRLLKRNIAPNLRDDMSHAGTIWEYVQQRYESLRGREYHPDLSRPTALMLTAGQGDIAVARVLLDKGADVNAHDGMGNTALLIATHSRKASDQMLELLLDRGADLYARNKLHRNAFGEFGPGRDVLVKRSVSAPHAQELVQAVCNNDVNTARKLLDMGVSANSREADEMIPVLEIAVEYDDKKMIRLLLDRGADPNMAGISGWPIFICAVMRDQADIIQALLDKGANVNAQDNRGHSARFIAYFEHKKCVDLLEKAGGH